MEITEINSLSHFFDKNFVNALVILIRLLYSSLLETGIFRQIKFKCIQFIGWNVVFTEFLLKRFEMKMVPYFPHWVYSKEKQNFYPHLIQNAQFIKEVNAFIGKYTVTCFYDTFFNWAGLGTSFFHTKRFQLLLITWNQVEIYQAI